jgi:hypothetical protein
MCVYLSGRCSLRLRMNVCQINLSRKHYDSNFLTPFARYNYWRTFQILQSWERTYDGLILIGNFISWTKRLCLRSPVGDGQWVNKKLCRAGRRSRNAQCPCSNLGRNTGESDWCFLQSLNANFWKVATRPQPQPSRSFPIRHKSY